MSKLIIARRKVLQIAESIADIVDTEVDTVNERMSDIENPSSELLMLKSIFKMTSMSTLMQATKLALDIEEGK